ncbi:MAG: uracil-DNA glycosylase, partial [Promethearchaeota archaeon]
MHGKTFQRNGHIYFVMYHPAAGLYNQDLVPNLQIDMQKLKQLLDSEEETKSDLGQQDLSNFFEKE